MAELMLQLEGCVRFEGGRTIYTIQSCGQLKGRAFVDGCLTQLNIFRMENLKVFENSIADKLKGRASVESYVRMSNIRM